MAERGTASLVEVVAWALVSVVSCMHFRRWQNGSSPTDSSNAAAATTGHSKGAGTGMVAHVKATAHTMLQDIKRDAQECEVETHGGGCDRQSSDRGGSSSGEEEEVETARWIGRAGHAIVDAAEEQAKSKVHIVGSSVNIPDMSANLKAKVKVSEQQQSNPALLAAVYDDMRAKFAQHGLNLPAVRAMRQYFTQLDGPGEPVPLDYDAFPVPLPPGAVRLGLIFFQECNSQLTQLVQQAAQEVLAVLPPGFTAHANKPSHYHITIYMTSQPHTLRPDPFNPASGGLRVDGTPQEQAVSAQPHPDTLQREIAAYRAAASDTDAPQLEVSRLLMADSGTLLLCSVDHTGNLARLRRRLRDSFPGGPTTQSTIVHSSIARLLTPQQLTREQIDRIQAVCDTWTERLRGLRFNPERCYHVQARALGCENTFTTVEGPRVPLPFRVGGPCSTKVGDDGGSPSGGSSTT